MDDGNPLKMKVTELKSELGKRGLSQTGLKFDLAQRLQTAMDVDEFGALPSLATPSQSAPCLPPSSNPNGRPACSSVDSCDDQTDSLQPVAAAMQGCPKHGVCPPQRSTAESTCSTNPTANYMLATDHQMGDLETRAAAPKIHEGETSILDASPGESISVMWGGDTRSKKLPKSVAGEERVVVASATPTKRDKEPIGKERIKNGAKEDSETQKGHGLGSAERTGHPPATSEEFCAEVVYQLETDKGREGDSERIASDSTQNRVEAGREKLVEMAEVPPLQYSAERGGRTCRRKPRGNVDREPEAAQELDKTVISRSERWHHSDDDQRVDAGTRQTAELLHKPSSTAGQDGCADLAHTTPANLGPGERLFVSPFSEIDKMKDREQRFGSLPKNNPADCSEPSCSGRGDDVHDDGRGGDNRREEESSSRSKAARLEVADTITAADTWKEKLVKRKARFGTPPLARSRVKATSEPIREPPRPLASEAAAKMARRAERFRETSMGSSACLVTAPATTPDPRGGSFVPPGPVEKVVAPLKTTAGGNAYDPLPQRRKCIRARNSSLDAILAPAKRRAITAEAEKRGDEGRVTLASALANPSSVVGTPVKGRTQAREPTKTKTPMKQRVRFLPVVSTGDGGSFVQGGHIPSPSRRPRAAAPASSPPPPSALSPSSISPSLPLCVERFGVNARPFSAKGRKTPPKGVGKGYTDKKASDQASKMRDRQKRFAQDIRTPRESTACS